MLLTTGALAKPPLDYQDPPPDPPGAGQVDLSPPNSLAPPASERLTGPGNFRRLPSIDESIPIVVATRTDPYWKAGQLDPVLTNACRLGDFGTPASNRLIVRFVGKEGRGVLYYVPPDRRFLLNDRRGLAGKNEIYYFMDPGTADCRVWVAQKSKRRALDQTRGTSLAKPDRNALKKRLDEIKSWPDSEK